MTRRPHLARNLALALIFALGLALIDPVAAGIAAVWTGEILPGGGVPLTNEETP